MMRQYQHEATLKEWANDIASSLWVRPEKGHPKYTEGDFAKKPTKKQREALFSVAYGALLSLNWGEDTRRDDEKGNAKAQAIIDCAEFTADLLFDSLLPEDERLQGYMSIYCPLKEAVRNWPTNC